MVNVILKPCQVQVNRDYVFIFLKSRCFTVEINNKIYEFIPKKETRVIVNRKTGKIVNSDALLAFERDNCLVYKAISELTFMPEFLIEIYYIAKPYYKENQTKGLAYETDIIIKELERMNVKRLIDQALDDKDEKRFYKLLKYLK